MDVAVDGQPIGQLVVQPPASLFEPGYSEFNDLPTNASAAAMMQVSLVVKKQPGSDPAADQPQVWGFISVTNNETQEITVVSPQL